MGFSCVTYNIQYGFGMDGQFDLSRIVDAVKDADLIAFQEVTRGMPLNGGVDMVATLRALLPDHVGVWGPSFQIALSESGLAGGDGAGVSGFEFGNMVFSKAPILSTRNHLLPRRMRTEGLNLQRSALEALVDTPAGPVRFYSVHLDHLSEAERLLQIEALLALSGDHVSLGGAATGLSAFGFPDLPVVDDFMLMGDFNLEPQDQAYAALCGASGGTEKARSASRHVVDVSRADRSAARDALTYHDPKGEDTSKRLDYCFASGSLAPRCSAARVDEEAVGSDHRPVWLDIG